MRISRSFAALVLLTYLAASTQLLPLVGDFTQHSSRANNGERYPCENCACGCATARECWTACCCHTPKQRLAWAIRNGVMPPDGVEFRDADWLAAASAVNEQAATEGVASIKARLAKGVALTPSEAYDCGEGTDTCCNAGRADADACCGEASSSKRPSGPQFSPLGCKGIAQALTFTSIGYPFAGPIEPPSYDAAVQFVRPLVSESASGLSRETPTPPPRV